MPNSSTPWYVANAEAAEWERKLRHSTDWFGVRSFAAAHINAQGVALLTTILADLQTQVEHRQEQSVPGQIDRTVIGLRMAIRAIEDYRGSTD